MRKIFLIFTLLILCSGTFIGCQTPEITLSLTLPSPVPIPDDIFLNQIGDFRVIDYKNEEINSYFKSVLTDKLGSPELRLKTQEEVTGIQPSTPALIKGAIHIKIDDKSGIRQLRRTDSTQASQTIEVPSMVRKVFLDVDFTIQNSQSNTDIVTIETHQNYNSLEDPDIRGVWGFERPDDPERIPPVSDIIKRLLNRSADSFVRMITPVEMTQKIKMRSTWDGNSFKAFSSLKKGDSKTAAMYCQKALQKDPENIALLFNMAVVCEANSDLTASLNYYQKVSKLTAGNDPEAEEGIIRVQRVHNIR